MFDLFSEENFRAVWDELPDIKLIKLPEMDCSTYLIYQTINQSINSKLMNSSPPNTEKVNSKIVYTGNKIYKQNTVELSTEHSDGRD